MRVHKDSVFELSLMPWEIEPPTTTLMLVVKATFDLQPDGPCTVAETQESCLGPVAWDEGETPSLRYATDYAVAKARGEFYVSGHAHAPGARPVTVLPVRARVGSLEKRLVVRGDRTWSRSVLGSRPSAPEPFATMPLCWERAAGGPGVAANPVGRGTGPIEGPDGMIDPVPNLEDPAHPIVSRDALGPPAGLFPLPNTWAARQRYLGTYDAAWVRSRWPFLPVDFDIRFFQCAPEDQQLAEGFFVGDETIELDGLSAEHPKLRTRLPGRRARVFIERARPRPPGAPPLELLSTAELGALGPPQLVEVPVVLDTVVLDSDLGAALCQWRGRIEVADAGLTDVARIFVVDEPLDEDRAHADYERALFELLCEEAAEYEDVPDEAAPLAIEPASPAPAPTEIGEAIARFEAELQATLTQAAAATPDPPAASAEHVRAQYTELGLDAEALLPEPDYTPVYEVTEPPSVLRLEALIRKQRGKSFAGRDLSDMPYRNLDLRGADFTGAVLTGADLSGADLRGACLDEAILTRANLKGSNFTDASLQGADLSDVDATEARFERACLDGAVSSEATLTRASFFQASLLGAEFMECEMTHCDLREARLDGADFVGSTLYEAGFVGSSMLDTSLESVKAPKAVFERCRMPDLRASDGADFTEANFVLVDAPRAQLQGATLHGANFSGSNLEEADFAECKGMRLNLLRCVLRGAKLDRADLREAVFIQSDLFEASFQYANLAGADARGAHLHTADLWRANTAGTLFEGADLTRTAVGEDDERT